MSEIVEKKNMIIGSLDYTLVMNTSVSPESFLPGDDFKYPTVSILTPTYNRRKFLNLAVFNIYNFDYPKDLMEWCILDDGPEPFLDEKLLSEVKRALSPVKIVYKYQKQKMSIGAKRNKLATKIASKQICAFMDDDDVYQSAYLKHSIFVLKKCKVHLVGCPSMILCYPNNNYSMSRINCQQKHQIHEATMVFRRKKFKSLNKFQNSSQSEGAKVISGVEKMVACTNILYVMICICHKDNTYNKEQFKKYDVSDTILITDTRCRDILSKISGVEFPKFSVLTSADGKKFRRNNETLTIKKLE